MKNTIITLTRLEYGGLTYRVVILFPETGESHTVVTEDPMRVLNQWMT